MNDLNKHKAVVALYPNVVSMVDDQAFDADGNEVSIDMSAVNTKKEELDTADINLKASAKAKLVAGEALTEEEANTIVL
mgnify:FL=1